MRQDMTPAVAAALTGAELAPFLLFEGVFASGTLRFWTGTGDLAWNGAVWTGAGTLIGMTAVEETGEVVANGVTVALSGVPLGLVQLAIAEARQGAPGRIWLGFLDPAGAVIAEPVQIFAGRLDEPVISEDAESCTIAVSYESRLVDLMRPREWRSTHESQQALHPGDLGFEYVAGLQAQEVTWGR